MVRLVRFVFPPPVSRTAHGEPARAVLLALTCLAVLGFAQAASVLDFPRASLRTDESTGFAIANPTGNDAEVFVTAYGAGGKVLAASFDPIRIGAGKQVAFLFNEVFRDLGLDADQPVWVQAFSATNGLTGFFLIFDGALTRLDGAETPARSRRLSFPQVRVGDGFSTELNLVNVNGGPANATLTLVGGAGPSVAQIQLAAREPARLDAAQLFGAQNVAQGSYILVESDEDLVGVALISTASGEVYALNARPVFEQLNRLYIPQLVALGAFRSRLGVANLSSGPVDLTIFARQADGIPFSGDGVVNPVSRRLGAGESLEEEVADFFGFSGQEGLEGWLEVISTSPAVSGYFAYELAQTGAAAAVSALAAGSRQALFSQLATARGFFTGVAGLNPSSRPASYRLVALDSEGGILGTFDGVLRPRERFSRLVTDVIPGAAGQSEGSILLRSTVPLFLTALFGTDNTSLLANIDPANVPQNFTPDEGIDTPRVDPQLAVLALGQSQSFEATGFSAPVEWSVNGVRGGNSEVGTIDEAGLYTAPAGPPGPLPLTISAAAGGPSAAAGVDILSPNLLAEYPNPINSLHYLPGTREIFTSEEGNGAAPLGQGRPFQGLVSTIFGMGSDGERRLVASLSGKEVADMVGFVARDGRSYLLLAGRNDARIARLEPASGAIQVVAEGLNGPEAMVFDPLTGNLLVAEANRVRSIPRRNLESDLTPAAEPGSEQEQPTSVVAPIEGLKGIAADACTGQIYVSQQPTGKLLGFNRENGEFRTVLDGLDEPGQMAGFYRSGVSCPDSFQLLIVEEGADQVTLLAPSTGEVISPWIPDIDLDDITLLPEDSPFSGRVAFDQEVEGETRDDLLVIDLPDLYDEGPINPPQMELVPFTVSPPGPDLSVSEATATAGQTASVNIFYRPGDDDGKAGGSDETDILLFTIDYDETRLHFDPTDSNGDGIPDAVTPQFSSEFDVFVAFDANAPEGELGFFVFDPAGAAASLPEGNLLKVSFRVLDGSVGTADVIFSPVLPPQGADSQGSRFSFDEVADGSISIAP